MNNDSREDSVLGNALKIAAVGGAIYFGAKYYSSKIGKSVVEDGAETVTKNVDGSAILNKTPTSNAKHDVDININTKPTPLKNDTALPALVKKPKAPEQARIEMKHPEPARIEMKHPESKPIKSEQVKQESQTPEVIKLENKPVEPKTTKDEPKQEVAVKDEPKQSNKSIEELINEEARRVHGGRSDNYENVAMSVLDEVGAFMMEVDDNTKFAEGFLNNRKKKYMKAKSDADLVDLISRDTSTMRGYEGITAEQQKLRDNMIGNINKHLEGMGIFSTTPKIGAEVDYDFMTPISGSGETVKSIVSDGYRTKSGYEIVSSQVRT